MNHYQGLAKKYRPQTFTAVYEQDAVVQTIKNALRFDRVGQAYLFCGTHGTGKTSLARLFAKALNCQNRLENGDPCNACASCKEIVSGHSLDVIEIDGASNRGIDDIRNLNETVGYASSGGKHKIYIIDEVHMLTKEAFNALLKTLEEPPEHVIFFFATTEPHKVLPTITSRCQRFDLKRISPEKIMQKLEHILQDLELKAPADALRLIAAHSNGSLRDAESLLDRILCYQDKELSTETISEILGLVSQDLFFELDQAIIREDFSYAFELSQRLFQEGCHLEYFLDSLSEHYRNLLLVLLGNQSGLSPLLTKEEKEQYFQSANAYSKEQCLDILNLLRLQLEQLAKSPFKRIDLEILLLQIIRSNKKMPLDHLVEQLLTLKSDVLNHSSKPQEPAAFKPIAEDPPPQTASANEPPLETPQEKTPEISVNKTLQKKIHHDKVMHFASVELNGSVRKN